MQKNAVKAATYKRANSESNLSWIPEKTDVILSKRELEVQSQKLFIVCLTLPLLNR